MATQILGKVAYTSRGAYDSSFSYEINDVVTYNGSSYVSLKETKGNLPTNENYWMLLAEKGDTYSVTEDDLKNIANQITEDANSSFNENVKTQTETFNTNVTTQTENFNTNATAKVEDYNTNHTDKVSDYNTNAETKLNEFNENASSYDERITANETNIARNTTSIKRLENNIFESGEAEGSIINVKDSVLSEAKKFEVDGVTAQETTEGKQLYNYKNSVTISDGVTVDEDGWITATYDNTNGTVTKYLNFNVASSEKIQPSTNYAVVVEVKKVSGSNCALYPCQNTAGNTMYQIIDDDKLEIDTTEAGTVRVIQATTLADFSNVSRMMNTFFGIRAGASGSMTFRLSVLEDTNITADTFVYEKYTNLLPSPNPDYPAPMSVIRDNFKLGSCGKNILSSDMFIDGIVPSVNSGQDVVSKDFSATSFIKIDNNLPLFWHLLETSVLQHYVFFYDENFNYISNSSGNMSKLGLISNLSNYKNAKYIRLRIDSPKGNITETQLEYNEEFTGYEPYQETSIDVTIPEGEFIAEGDTLSVEYNEEDGENHLYLNKNIGEKILDGSDDENIRFDANLQRFYSVIQKSLSTNVNSKDFVCDYFTPNNILGIKGTVVQYGQAYYFYYGDLFTTLAEVKAWLAENNVTVLYRLAEPYRIDLGAVSQLKTYSDETNVFTDSELQPNIYMLYNRNFKTTVRNLQVNEGKLQEELASMQTKISNLESAISSIQTSLASESEVVE